MVELYEDEQTSRPGIVILGASLVNGNYGVRALAASLVKIFTVVSPETRLFFLYGNKEPVEPQRVRVGGREREVYSVNYRMSLRSGLGRQIFWLLLLGFASRLVPSSWKKLIIQNNVVLRTIAEAKFVGDIRGGDSFSDIYGVKNFIVGSLPALLALSLNKRFVLFPQTIGPFKSGSAERLARLIVRSASVVMVRDRTSQQVAASLRDTGQGIVVCPDVAFMLEPNPVRVIEACPPLDIEAKDQRFLGINVSGLLYHRGRDFGLNFDYSEFIDRLLHRLLEGSPSHIVLIPHSEHFYSREWYAESDSHACDSAWQRIPSELRSRVHLISRVYDQYQVKYLIGQCDFFVGARMHACIAALSQCVPTVGVAYSRKFYGVFESIGQEDAVIDARVMTLEDGLLFVENAFARRQEYKERLNKEITLAQKKISDAFGALCLSPDLSQSPNSEESSAPAMIHTLPVGNLKQH